MNKLPLSVALLGICATFLVGCSGGDQPAITKAQEDAMRHPTKDPNWKGPDPEGQKQMGQAIAAWAEKHKNDKVEFK